MPHGKSDIGKSQDRGPREFKTHIVGREGNVMLAAENEVVTMHPMNSIKNVARMMKEHDFRRIPITDAGTGRLEGLAVALDIIDFLGGGEKYNIITKDYDGNLLSAINCPIGKIAREASFVDKKASIDDVVKIIIEKHTSAIPIVNDAKSKKVIAIITEIDVLPTAESLGITVGEVMNKAPITSSLGMMISDVTKVMVRNRFRRLPVIKEDKVIGIITVSDILRFLGYGEFHGVKAEEVLSERVENIMSKDVITVSRDHDIGDISKIVRETGIGGFPVVKDDKLVGLVTISDVIRAVYGGDREI